MLTGLLAGEEGVALVGVGGYGRAELCPGSDVDVVLLHRGGKGRNVKALAEQLWYPVWDSGLKLGHAVRTVKEAAALAAGDLNTATSLLDTRLVAGDTNLADELAERALAQWRGSATRWLETLARSVEERHAKAGEVAFLLEPDLKEGRGGLRDAHALAWAEAARRVLLEGDDDQLRAAYDVLLDVRVELQRRTRKADDRLLLQDQDAVAGAVGADDADQLMASVAAAARTIAWMSDEAWDRIGSTLRGPAGRAAGGDTPLGDGLLLRDGLVELAPSARPDTDRTLVLRAAAAAATACTRLSRPALDTLAAEAASPGDTWPEEARRALVRLLGAGRSAIPVLEAFDQRGLLVRLLPEWEAVRCRPQRNAYHRFTVDRHLCEAAAEAAALTDRVERPDLLLVGTWLHDIGKGFADGAESDHSVSGTAVVRRIVARMGFSPADVDVVATLVRHHLLLADVATRRDIDDPATVAPVVDAVGDVGTLELLHALTEADATATGPAAWSPWKAGLVDDLVSRARRALSGAAAEAVADFPTPDHVALARQVGAGLRGPNAMTGLRGPNAMTGLRGPNATTGGDVVVRGHESKLTVVAPDRPGLFCKVAGTLAIRGLDVLVARAWSSDDGVAVEDFEVEAVLGGSADWAAFEDDLRRVLSGRLSLEARVAERARAYASRSRSLSALPARAQVRIDDKTSPTATVVEVHAPDRIGTLYRITRALSDLELDIRSAKVATLGHEVVDAFYVVDATGSKLDADHVKEVERAILLELSRV